MTATVTIPPEIAAKVRERQPFKDARDLQGYRTRGGTYVIATQGRTANAGAPRDLLAIVPGDAFAPVVVRLWPAVRHELVVEIERIVA